jgi:tetratricopeptide (TPR) repeat protein
LPGLLLLGWLLYPVPPIHDRLAWRVELALIYLRGVLYPAGPLPTPRPAPQTTEPMTTEANEQALTPTPTLTPSPVPTLLATPIPSPTITPSPTPLPSAVSLPPPAWERQTMNNCGPASLSLYLKFYGWEGDQALIAQVIKPVDEDRNVNVEEMVYYVRNHAGWLNAEFRVGGDLATLKRLLAAGIPVLIEESFYFTDPYWPSDDLWAAHYLLLTGYDDATQIFTGQDSYHGANQKMGYQALDAQWKIFNRVYIMVYLPGQEATVKAVVGSDWDVEANRQRALATAQAEAQANPQDAFAWFNVGTNLVYFERWAEAAQAYDTARTLGLPQRMLRYQFGPFFAYFHSGRMDELKVIVDYALQRTPNSEEALVWQGWARYREGDTAGAVSDWRAALESNPNSQDARYALDFVGAIP